MMNSGRHQILTTSTGCRQAYRHERMKRFVSQFSWLLFAWTSLFAGQASAAELDCLVKPEMYVEVSSPVISVIEEVLVETGDVVTRGQPLVKLEASIEKIRVRRAELQVKHTSDIENRKEQTGIRS